MPELGQWSFHLQTHRTHGIVLALFTVIGFFLSVVSCFCE